MFSWPPATTISLSPVATAWAASITAFRPEPQTALMVRAGVSLATPAFIMAWRAGFWPAPAASTWPMMTSPTWSVDRKSTRLNSSHLVISYAVFCLKKKKNHCNHSQTEVVPCYVEPRDLSAPLRGVRHQAVDLEILHKATSHARLRYRAPAASEPVT